MSHSKQVETSEVVLVLVCVFVKENYYSEIKSNYRVPTNDNLSMRAWVKYLPKCPNVKE